MWKKYRGGQTTRIWLARLSDSSITKVPRTNSNDFNPMWAGDRVYFLSDRNGPVTLFSYDTKTQAVREAIPNTGLDLKSASLGPDAIVYEQFGGIFLYDLKSGKTKAGSDSRARRFSGTAAQVRERGANAGESGGLAERRSRGFCGARRYHHRAGGKRRSAQSDQYPGGDGARTAVVAGRQEHRLPFR